MSNLNWKKQTDPNKGRPDTDRAFESNAAARAVTEDELEAYRFRGTPIRRPVVPVVPQPLPGSHQGNGGHASAGGLDESKG